MDGPSPEGPASRAPHPGRRGTVVAILLAMFMSAMEATVVATAMPTVIADLSGLELYGWVGAVYMLAMTVTIPIWGKLADVRGRRPVLLTGLTIFLAGSLGSGLARSMPMLVAMRGLQGLGAGGLQPVTLTIVGDLFTLEERGRMQGLFGAVWGISAMVGPLLGGVIVRALSWRWVFFVNLPIGLLCAALLLVFYRERRQPRAGAAPPLDALGALLLSAGVLSILLGAGGTAPALTLPAAAALLAAFVQVERRAVDPLLPLPLLARPLLRTGALTGALTGAVMMGTLLFTPLFAQGVLGASPTEAGTSIAPMLVGWPLASALAGRAMRRVGFRAIARAGLALVLAGGVLLALGCAASVQQADLWYARGASFVMGAGMGLANTALILAVQESVTHAERGVATATTIFARSIGGALAVGALGALLAARVAGVLPPHVLDELLRPDHATSFDPARLASYKAAVRDGMNGVFLAIAALGGAALVAGLGLPNLVLGAQGAAQREKGLEARR